MARSRILAALTVTILLATVAGGATAARASTVSAGGPVKLAETGSSLLYPLMGEWAAGYHRQHARVSITTASTGSGAGIDGASKGTADIGASDAYLSSGDLVGNPTLLNIPVAISAQQVNYNLPSLPSGHTSRQRPG